VPSRAFSRSLNKLGRKEVIILYVLDERGIDAAARYAPGRSAEVQENMREDAMKDLRSIEKESKEHGFKVDPRVTVGIPLREILNIEEKENISVIVLGSHGKSNIEEMLLGSVSEKVIRKCKKPVLVIKR